MCSDEICPEGSPSESAAHPTVPNHKTAPPTHTRKPNPTQNDRNSLPPKDLSLKKPGITPNEAQQPPLTPKSQHFCTHFLYQLCQNYPAKFDRGWLSLGRRARMSIGINHLAYQPWGGIWHPSCNRRKR